MCRTSAELVHGVEEHAAAAGPVVVHSLNNGRLHMRQQGAIEREMVERDRLVRVAVQQQAGYRSEAFGGSSGESEFGHGPTRRAPEGCGGRYDRLEAGRR